VSSTRPPAEAQVSSGFPVIAALPNNPQHFVRNRIASMDSQLLEVNPKKENKMVVARDSESEDLTIP